MSPTAAHNADRETGVMYRYHVHESGVSRAVRAAAAAGQVSERVTSHAFRHNFATRLLEDGAYIRTMQSLLGHKVVRTTIVYTHVLQRGPVGLKSPLDRLGTLI